MTPWQAEPFFAGGNLGILEREVFGMNENIVKRNALLAQKVIKGLKSRNMTGYYAADKEEALKIALSIIP